MEARPSATVGEFSRGEIAKELQHDYSSSDTGIVPPDRRRSRYHFLALWVTFTAGFTYLFLGFQYHDAGYPLAKAVRRAVAPIPPWRGAGLGNWPGIAAIMVAVLFGAWGLGLFPGQATKPPLGLVPVEAWLIAGAVYLALAVAVPRSLLGFPKERR
jgi:hypothetical protein